MTPILRKALLYGTIVAVAVTGVASVIGNAVAGTPGLLGALVGGALSAVFLAITSVSMLVAQRLTRDDPTNPLFFGVVVGVLGIKMVLFLVVILWLRGQDWLDLGVFAFTSIATVVGSLIADAAAFTRARVPYVGDVKLPGE